MHLFLVKSALNGSIIVVGTLLGVASHSNAQSTSAQSAHIVSISSKIHVVGVPQGNIVVFTGAESSFVLGVQTPTLAAEVRAFLQTRNASPVRYVLLAETDSIAAHGDAGWSAAGAVSMVHENLFSRIARARAMRAASSNPDVSYQGSDLPKLSFSQVVQLRFADEEVHLIRERAGATNADVLAHFEREGVVYLGWSFTNDGYPNIDKDRGGDIDSLIAILDFFVNNFQRAPAAIEPIIPGRGPLATFQDLSNYRNMLVAVRDRVRTMRASGKSLSDVLNSKVSADFDSRWGMGPVTPDRFVSVIYAASAK